MTGWSMMKMLSMAVWRNLVTACATESKQHLGAGGLLRARRFIPLERLSQLRFVLTACPINRGGLPLYSGVKISFFEVDARQRIVEVRLGALCARDRFSRDSERSIQRPVVKVRGGNQPPGDFIQFG